MELFKKVHAQAFPETDPIEIAIAEALRSGPKDEMIRIADHWRTSGKDIETDDLAEKISNDLEMLEYGPDEVAQMTTSILRLIGRQV